jgi:hypothetical protein
MCELSLVPNEQINQLVAQSTYSVTDYRYVRRDDHLNVRTLAQMLIKLMLLFVYTVACRETS